RNGELMVYVRDTLRLQLLVKCAGSVNQAVFSAAVDPELGHAVAPLRVDGMLQHVVRGPVGSLAENTTHLQHEARRTILGDAGALRRIQLELDASVQRTSVTVNGTEHVGIG